MTPGVSTLKLFHWPYLQKVTYLQVADFLGELLDEMVGSDMVRNLTGGLRHLERERAYTRNSEEPVRCLH